MKGKRQWLIGMGLLGLVIAGGAAAHDRDRDHRFTVSTALKSGEEVPAISSPASGFFKATVDTDNQTISFELKYDGIATAPLQAHIHFGQFSVNGGVSVFLCANIPVPAGPTPAACPASPGGTVTGTLMPENVIGPNAPPTVQGIAAGEFDELVAAIRKGLTYVNVHSSAFPGGEIRGQLDNVKK
jgi:hypothetical protein